MVSRSAYSPSISLSAIVPYVARRWVCSSEADSVSRPEREAMTAVRASCGLRSATWEMGLERADMSSLWQAVIARPDETIRRAAANFEACG